MFTTVKSPFSAEKKIPKIGCLGLFTDQSLQLLHRGLEKIDSDPKILMEIYILYI